VVICLERVYGPADATAIPKPRHLLPHLNLDWFYLSGTAYTQIVLEKCSSGSSSSSSSSSGTVASCYCACATDPDDLLEDVEDQYDGADAEAS